MMKLAVLILMMTVGGFITHSQNPLFIPPIDSGTWIGGARTFNLIMENDSTEFQPGIWTPTAGYNGSFLGPTLYMEKDDSLVFNVTNYLGENTTTHWHGLHVPAIMDGGPHQMIADNATWTATFNMLNEASTVWYHPHHKPTVWTDSDGTGGQVHRGLTGMMIIEDVNSQSLGLPNNYGIDEIPLIIQDRAFWPDGTFKDATEIIPFLIGRIGDTMLVNGTLNAEHQTYAQMIRYRVLNASNTRTYYLGFDDDRYFDIIATDGGLLNSPVSLNRIRLSPGERVEMVVDFSADNGSIITLMSYGAEFYPMSPVFAPSLVDSMDTSNFDIMTFNVGPPTVTPTPIFSLPSTLNSIVAYDTLLADVERSFALSGMQINGLSMDMMVINDTMYMGDVEHWTIINTSNSYHPLHIHGQQFQVIARSEGPVELWEQGWKDVVYVARKDGSGNPGWVKIMKPFEDFGDSIKPFMYHCHILEHEDNGMMGQFIVLDTTTSNVGLSEPSTMGQLEIRIYPNPFKNSVKIRSTLGLAWSGQFSLLTIDGKLVNSIEIEAAYGETIDVDLNPFPKGTYIYKIQTNSTIRSGRLVKN